MNQIRITWRHINPNEQVIDLVDRESHRLGDLHPEATGCQVLIDRHHRSHHKGNRPKVRVQVSVPGHQIIATSRPLDCSDSSVGQAVADAFHSIRRSLGSHRWQRSSGSRHRRLRRRSTPPADPIRPH